MKSNFTSILLSLLVLISCSQEHKHECKKEDSCCKNETTHSKEKSTDDQGSFYDISGLTYTNHLGKAQSLSDMKGKYVFVSMIFTQCKYACPKIAENIQALESALNKPFQVVLISFDPKRDNPQTMSAFLNEKKAGKNWTVMTSTDDIIRKSSMLFDISFKELENGDFSHENVIIVLDKQGREIKRIEGLNINVQQEATEILDLLGKEA